MQQSACLVINPITVDIFAALFKCTPVGVRLYDGPDHKLFILVRLDWSFFVCCLVQRGSTDDLRLLHIFNGFVWQTRDLHLACTTLYLLSPRLCFFIELKRELIVYRDDSLSS